MTTILSLRPQRWLLAFALLAAGFGPLAHRAAADIHIEAVETGGNVIFTFSGSFDTPATPSGTLAMPTVETYMHPSQGAIVARQTSREINRYNFLNAIPFGTGSAQYNVGAGSGDNIGVSSQLELDSDYVDGSPINATLTFANTTLSALGIDPSGSPYVWDMFGTTDKVRLTITGGGATRAKLFKKIRKLERKAKKLSKKGKKAKARKLKSKVRKLKKQLAKL